MSLLGSSRGGCVQRFLKLLPSWVTRPGLFAGVAWAVLQASPANAQATGRIDGKVVDPAGRAIAGAEVTIAGNTQHVETDAGGAFRVTGVPAGTLQVRVRRLGFRADTAVVDVAGGQTVPLTVALEPLPVLLASVTVLGKHYTGRLAAFYKRRDRGGGHFFTREEIEHRNPANATDLMRTLPGISVQAMEFGRQTLRFRSCRQAPLVWLDGHALGAGEFDIDNLAVRSIEAIEVYAGGAGLPVEFSAGPTVQGCGTIAIWLRQGERRARKRSKGESVTAEIRRRVEAQETFTADQVDRPAHPDSSRSVIPVYPQDLYRSATPGDALVEFIVDPDGTVDEESFNVVWASHPLFGESVRRALRESRWIPAVKQGRGVRQVLQQPYRFVPDSTPRSGGA